MLGGCAGFAFWGWYMMHVWKVLGFGLQALGLGFWVLGLRFRVWGLRFRV